MEEYEHTSPSYWQSVGMAAVGLGFLSFILELMLQYFQLSAEGSTGGLIVSTVGSVAVCLFMALGGLIAIWHYAKTYNLTLSIGRGALIGFFTGVGLVIVSVVLSQMWTLIDPDLNQRMMESMIRTYEEMDIPEEFKEQLIDATAAEVEDPSILMSVLSQIPVSGILNLLSGMLGVALFAREKQGDNV